MLSLTNGTAPSWNWNWATSGNGFLSAITAIEFVPGTLLVISIGTTAPFSAISGASMRMSLLGAAPVMPMPFSAASVVFAPNASLFHAANAAQGLASPRATMPSTVLRSEFMAPILPRVVARLAAAFLLQAQVRQCHPPIDGLHHVVDREQADRRGGKRLHLDAGLALAFDG